MVKLERFKFRSKLVTSLEASYDDHRHVNVKLWEILNDGPHMWESDAQYNLVYMNLHKTSSNNEPKDHGTEILNAQIWNEFGISRYWNLEVHHTP